MEEKAQSLMTRRVGDNSGVTRLSFPPKSIIPAKVRHSRVPRDFLRSQAGIHVSSFAGWIPACAGMTGGSLFAFAATRWIQLQERLHGLFYVLVSRARVDSRAAGRLEHELSLDEGDEV